MDSTHPRTLEYRIVRRPRDGAEDTKVARSVDRSVLVVSALAAFFATLFAALLLLQSPSEPASEPLDAPDTPRATQPLPDVGAPPPPAAAAVEPTAPEETAARPHYEAIRQRLEQLGVECRSAHCFPD